MTGARKRREISADSSGAEVQAQTIESAEGGLNVDELLVALEGDNLQAATSQQTFSNIYQLMQGLCAGVIQQEPLQVVDHSVSDHHDHALLISVSNTHTLLDLVLLRFSSL